ncbi:hypothetical protein QR680_013481 [Steinernema hermaphroditum]|uniref:Uncharacterized protein n=1 Tax=Steinernema hermaphroditum TaxID=289476 RepID=A0AA39M2F1_9BILA|nr:hypothetical protein QR680_013481 [Steinernema hermaphroditum]
MNVPLFLAFTLFVSAQADQSYLPGTWLAWTSSCSDVCGLCGTTVRIRRCLQGTCVSFICAPSDRGDVRQYTKERCGQELCAFPRRTCCGKARIGLHNKKLACVMPS